MKIRLDTSDINAAIHAIAALFEPATLQHVPNGLIERLRNLIVSDGLKVCVANLGSATTADDHVIRFGVCGELLEIAAAARAFYIDRNVSGVGHLESPYGS